MSNYAYLCSSDFSRLYPSERYKPFDGKQDYLACDVDAVPLLWLAMFRPGDIRRQSVRFRDADESDPVVAPLAPKQVALDQLMAAVGILNRLFRKSGRLDPHADCLAEAVRSHPGKFVSLETIEIAAMHGESEFNRYLRRALKFFASPEPEIRRLQERAEARDALNHATLVEKIRHLRQRTDGSIAGIKAVLEQNGGNVKAAIEHFEGLKTPLQRAIDATAYYSSPRRDDGSELIDELFANLCQLKLEARFPSPAAFQGDQEQLTADELWNYSRLLGEEVERSVPW